MRGGEEVSSPLIVNYLDKKHREFFIENELPKLCALHVYFFGTFISQIPRFRLLRPHLCLHLVFLGACEYQATLPSTMALTASLLS